MSKQPYIALYPGDWERDANCLTSNAEFALFKLTIKLNDAKNKGVFIANFDTLSVLFKCDLDGATRAIKELRITKTLDILDLEDGFIEIKSRRILREKAISESRAQNGKQGGRGRKKNELKQSKSKVKANTQQNTENEIESEYVNEVVIESNSEEKKYARDQFFEVGILKFFGFSEMPHFHRQHVLLSACCGAQFSAQRFEYFKEQCGFYEKYIGLIGTRFKTRFEKFIGSQENRFGDGEWMKENWKQKYLDRISSPAKPPDASESKTAAALRRHQESLAKIKGYGTDN
jgi:hypothetical protein